MCSTCDSTRTAAHRLLEPLPVPFLVSVLQSGIARIRAEEMDANLTVDFAGIARKSAVAVAGAGENTDADTIVADADADADDMLANAGAEDARNDTRFVADNEAVKSFLQIDVPIPSGQTEAVAVVAEVEFDAREKAFDAPDVPTRLFDVDIVA